MSLKLEIRKILFKSSSNYLLNIMIGIIVQTKFRTINVDG